MKSYFLAASLLGIVAVVGCSPDASSPADGTSAAVVPVGMTKVVLSVPDMHCPISCGPAVSEALAGCEGVDKESINTDIENREVTIYTDPDNFDMDGALAKLDGEGFPASVKQ